ncbi:ribose 5-phosphate isomerase B [bacterium]|nr:ribose 5-phosphate isomerase B [bacterium]
MQIAIGSDHSGFKLKEHLVGFLKEKGYLIRDLGTSEGKTVDYPDIARAVALEVVNQKATTGIIIDGAGIGSSIVANKVPQIRAALCNDLYTAHNAREHNNANILVLGSQVVGPGKAEKIVDIFLKTAFAGGRHERRVNKIDQMDGEYRGPVTSGTQPTVEEIVTKIVQRFVSKQQQNQPESKPLANESSQSQSYATGSTSPQTHLIGEAEIKSLVQSGKKTLEIDKRTIITPLAHDLIREKKIQIISRNDER